MARILFFGLAFMKFSEISNNKPVFTIFFIFMTITFFSLRFNLFSIMYKEFNQIRKNVVRVVARLTS